MSALDKKTEATGMELMRVGDQAVSQATIQSSYLYKDLAKTGFPKQLAGIFGLHDIQTATAIQGVSKASAKLIDMVRAELLLEMYKSELRNQNYSDDQVEMAVAAAVASGSFSRPAPYMPVFPELPGGGGGVGGGGYGGGTPAAVRQNVPLTINPLNLPGGGGSKVIAPGMGVAGAVPAGGGFLLQPGVEDAFGIVSQVNGNQAHIAFLGELVTLPNANYTPGLLYYTSVNNPGVLVPYSALVPGQQAKPLARAIAPTQLLVLDWPKVGI